MAGSDQRFAATAEALRMLRKDAGNIRILLAFTGDATALQRLSAECGWPAHDANWFEQSAEATPFGKGLLEHHLIGRALQHWKLAEHDTTVLKLTAKYTVENLQDVLRLAAGSVLPLYGWLHPGKPLIDTRCFFFQARAYKNFAGHLDRIDDRQGYYMEHAVHDIMHQLRIRPGWLRHRPLICGLSGSTGVTVRTAAWKRFLVHCASLLRPLPVMKHTPPSNAPPTASEIQLVLPSLKVSGGIAEALKLARDLETTGTRVGTVAMWDTAQSLSQQPPS